MLIKLEKQSQYLYVCKHFTSNDCITGSLVDYTLVYSIFQWYFLGHWSTTHFMISIEKCSAIISWMNVSVPCKYICTNVIGHHMLYVYYVICLLNLCFRHSSGRLFDGCMYMHYKFINEDRNLQVAKTFLALLLHVRQAVRLASFKKFSSKFSHGWLILLFCFFSCFTSWYFSFFIFGTNYKHPAAGWIRMPVNKDI